MRRLLPLLLAACGGGAGVVPDAGPEPDGGGPGVPDAAIRADARQDCPVPTSYVAPSAATATATRDAEGVVSFSVELDAVGPDRFRMILEKRGVFLDGPVTGQFPIAGAQLDNATCALCLLVDADLDGADETYFATGGLVRLDAVSGRLTGTLTDVDFEHVSIADAPPHASTSIPDGCVTRISSMSFDVAITGP